MVQRISFDRDPQVFTVLVAIFFSLLLFRLWVCDCGSTFATTPASISTTTATTMTTNQQRCEDDNQRQSQKNDQADRVVEALVVFGYHKVPDVVEELQNRLRHDSARVLQIPLGFL